MKYSLKHIAEICGGEFYGADVIIDAVMVDSRRSYGADEHPLFVAIRGANFDGHDFIGELYRRGVRGFMVEGDVDYAAYSGAGFARVENSIRGLHFLARDYRSSFKGAMVAITGSSGKTTLKEWIAQLAPRDTTVFRSPRSYNSQLGVPLSILMMSGEEDMALIEAGISRPGEMERLADIIRPDVGIFTMLGGEHGENFISAAHKAEEKARLFASSKKIIYSSRYPVVERTLKSKYPNAELFDAVRFEDASTVAGDAAARENKALVAAFYEAAGRRADEVLPLLPELRPATMRFDITEGLNGSLVISDRDNTDINSLEIAVSYMKNVAAERQTMLILSDILYSSLPDAELYRKVSELIDRNGIDCLVGIGERVAAYFGAFNGHKEFYRTAEEFLGKLTADKIEGRAILVEGNMSAGFSKIIHHLERKSHTTVMEIDLDAVIGNLNYFRSLLPAGTKLMAMVKASGYGNGNYELANTLYRQGVDYLAVAFADEGVRLREAGITMPIVVLNADSDSFDLMAAHRLEPEIYSFASLKAFTGAVKGLSESPYPIHIKLDTGMHRLGFERKDMEELSAILSRERMTVVVRSIFSHLAAADMPSEDEFTRRQITEFEELSSAIMCGLPYKPLRHIANSAGMERFPEAHYDMCRLGIGLYGVSISGNNVLRPVSRLTTRIVQIKELGGNESVGYGRAGRLNETTRVATIPAGYADGLDRRLGEGLWSVLAGGARAPIIGRVCMDSCMIDVTGINCGEGDEVTIFGPAAGNTVEDMAAVLGTIPYEIMTSVSERVKRIYIKE